MKIPSIPRISKKYSLALALFGTAGAANLITGGLVEYVQAHVAIGGTPPGLSEEYFTGGKNGTVFSSTSRCFELPSPAIDADPKLSEMFPEGELIFEADFVTDPDAPYGGLGPVYNNVSCRNCHPNYGRARRVENFKSHQFGNGYIAFVHTKEGKFVDGYKFMLQTMATPPYQPPADDVKLTWNVYSDEYGNKYPDGTPYNEGKEYEGTLIYPTAEIVNPMFPLPEGAKVSIEGTIGIVGTGLLDAIPDEDIIAEYERQQALPGPIKGKHGPWKTEPYDGKKHLGKFTSHNARASLQNGPGFNGSWSVYNMTRTDRPKLFATQKWIDKQGEMGLDTSLLTAHQPEEITQDELEKLMVWSRGLGVPAARNLDDPKVQQGKRVFNAIGCNQCHKPSWVTEKDHKYIPGFSNQKIWPYTDLLMHDMGEVNHGLSKTIRTPPIWARQLMLNAVDHTDMWHDLRARDFEETILWHYGEGNDSRERFRNLSKDERQSLIKFLKAI